MTCGRSNIIGIWRDTFGLLLFEFSCCDLIGQLVEKLQSHQELELVADLAETDENLTVSLQQCALFITCANVLCRILTSPT